MAVRIRLTRKGTKKRPYYQIVAADSQAPRDGRFIEKLGTYNPLLNKDNPQRVMLNAERVSYWITQGAKPTDRVWRFLDDAGLSKEKRPTPNNPQKGLPGKKAQERLAQEQEAKEKAEAEANTQENISEDENTPSESE